MAFHARKRSFETKKPAKRSFSLDEDVLSSDEDSNQDYDDTELSDGEDLNESAAQKRKRLAKTYMSKIGEQNILKSSHGISNDEVLSSALKDERLDSQGKLYRVASKDIGNRLLNATSVTLCGHKSTVTSVCFGSSESVIFSGSKDNSIVCWDSETGKKTRLLREAWSRTIGGHGQAHDGEVLSLAASTDGRYLASGCRDGILRIYDVRSPEAIVRTFGGHRGAITCLSFRRDSSALFSGSSDRCVKHWDVNDMGYIETMFGHQDEILSLDCGTRERPVTSSSDRTIRIWKVQEGSHLVLRGEKSSVDAVQMLTEDSYITGAQDGSLGLWVDSAKKPIYSKPAVHGCENGANARWIVSLAALKMTDVAVSGSYDGFVRIWRADAHGSRSIDSIGVLPLRGFVNSLAVSQNLIVAGSGNEHKLGRWWRIPGNLNKVTIWRLNTTGAKDS